VRHGARRQTALNVAKVRFQPLFYATIQSGRRRSANSTLSKSRRSDLLLANNAFRDNRFELTIVVERSAEAKALE
jgi:hypothetical protein